MKQQKHSKSIAKFNKEKVKKQHLIKGGPTTPRGTETAVIGG